MKGERNGKFEGIDIVGLVVLRNVLEQRLLVAQMEIVFQSVVHLNRPVQRVFEVINVLLLFPLSPDEIAPAFIILRKVFLSCPRPPHTSLDDLSDQAEIIALAHIVIQVAFADNWLHIPIFLIQSLVQLLEKLLIRTV